MFYTVKELNRYTLAAKDGEIGRITDFLIDDQLWTIRYAVADTGKWIPHKKVLLSPISIEKPNLDAHTLPVSLTKEQIENSPQLDSHAPISRQHEVEMHQYYGWPAYWGMRVVPNEADIPESAQPSEADSHLRSAEELIGYAIHASDGTIGSIEDIIFDKATWVVRYLVIETGSHWMPMRKVIVSPSWIKEIKWEDEEVYVDMNTQDIKQSPPFNAYELHRTYEESLHQHYNKKGYWD